MTHKTIIETKLVFETEISLAGTADRTNIGGWRLGDRAARDRNGRHVGLRRDLARYEGVGSLRNVPVGCYDLVLSGEG